MSSFSSSDGGLCFWNRRICTQPTFLLWNPDWPWCCSTVTIGKPELAMDLLQLNFNSCELQMLYNLLCVRERGVWNEMTSVCLPISSIQSGQNCSPHHLALIWEQLQELLHRAHGRKLDLWSKGLEFYSHSIWEVLSGHGVALNVDYKVLTGHEVSDEKLLPICQW